MTARALLLLGLGTAALSLSACNPAPYTQGDPPPSEAYRDRRRPDSLNQATLTWA